MGQNVILIKIQQGSEPSPELLAAWRSAGHSASAVHDLASARDFGETSSDAIDARADALRPRPLPVPKRIRIASERHAARLYTRSNISSVLPG